MGLFGGKDDTKQKIEELKARMQGGQQQGGQYPQQPWQGQQQQNYQPPQQSWQPPSQQEAPKPPEQRAEPPQEPRREEIRMDYRDEETTGIIIDLGDGMSLNLPVKSHMRLDEFLRIADRVRELKRIDHPQQHY